MEPRRLLAIETSDRPGSVALRWDTEPRGTALSRERAHGADLLPAVQSLFDALAPGIPRASRRVDALAVGIGPGSFTGLRVGIATALALGRAWDVPVVGVPSFEAIALRALHDGESGTVLADARAGRLYLARYARRGARLEVLRAPAAVGWDELEEAEDGADEIWFVDEPLRARLGASFPAQGRVRERPPADAREVLALGDDRLRTGTADTPVEPLYLMAFGARRAPGHETTRPA